MTKYLRFLTGGGDAENKTEPESEAWNNNNSIIILFWK